MLQHLVVSLRLMLTILRPWVLNCTQLSPVLGGIQLNYTCLESETVWDRFV